MIESAFSIVETVCRNVNRMRYCQRDSARLPQQRTSDKLMTSTRMPDAFDAIPPPAITAAALRNGNEWVLPLPHAKEAIKLASEHLIAVLGVECFTSKKTDFAWRTIPDMGSIFSGISLPTSNKTTAPPFSSLRRTNSATGTVTLTTSSERSLRASTGRSG